MRKDLKKFVVLVMLLALVACTSMGATNTSVTNVGVTSYEATGVLLAQAFSIEKALLKAGKITAAQDKNFQLGVYAKAVNGYKAVGAAAVAVLTATDTKSKTTAQDKFNTLNAQLPVLITAVTNFIQGVK